MAMGGDLPDDILEAVRAINILRDKQYLNREEKEKLNRAKLRIAYWVCRNEGIIANRENLSYILGSDAAEIMRAYDKYLVRDSGPAASRNKKSSGGDPAFWGKV